MHMLRFSILSSAVSEGELREYSEDFDHLFSGKKGASYASNGVRSRTISKENPAVFGARVLMDALNKASMSVCDLDMILFASASREQAIPCTAALIHYELGESKSRAVCVDIDATCLSFMFAFEMAATYLHVGKYKRIAVVCAETGTRFLNYNDPATASLFGDGAVAYILSDEPKITMEHVSFETHTDGALACQILGGMSKMPAYEFREENSSKYLFQMNGKKLYALASRHFPPFIERFLEAGNIDISEIDCFIPHQASGPALHLICKKLGVPAEKLVSILEDRGNQVSASIPTALHVALEQGKVMKNDRVMLFGTGAGLTLGAMLLRF